MLLRRGRSCRDRWTHNCFRCTAPPARARDAMILTNPSREQPVVPWRQCHGVGPGGRHACDIDRVVRGSRSKIHLCIGMWLPLNSTRSWRTPFRCRFGYSTSTAQHGSASTKREVTSKRKSSSARPGIIRSILHPQPYLASGSTQHLLS